MKEDENPKHKRKRLYKAKGESGDSSCYGKWRYITPLHLY
jgi:hypothetical protein